MKELKSISIILFLVISLLNATALAKSVGELLQEGLYAEEIEGDLDAAIKIYEQIITSKVSNKHTAQAMYRLGMCYLKKQNQQRAKTVFEELIAKYPEQTQIIDKVKPLLDEMSNPDPALLMPPDTLIYLEIGSPGQQVETILNMLKGTPFANPLTAIGGGVKPDGKSPGNKSPAEVMAALLNPSMMAEFKKIRGMAIGLTDIRSNNPPSVAVLYPGKSDALRGILLAALGVALQPGEPIAGMQTLRMREAVGAAYDDDVIIIAQPPELLTWCAKQYKGITDEPTLVSNNKAFSRLSRKQREQNAVTVWVDVDQTYASVIKQVSSGKMPHELRVIDGIGDLGNIDDVIAHLSLHESSITVEVNVGFKDGHHCLAYDLIRTPNLSETGFEAVPSGTIAVASLAIGEAEGAGTVTVQKTIEKLTGLNIAREIFGNIEQITFFALPPSPASKKSVLAKQSSPTLPCLGLTVTSHNPQQTHRLLIEMLAAADRIQNTSVNKQSDVQPNHTDNKYCVGLVDNQPIYCYIDQVGKSTILTLSPEVMQSCLSALKNQQSILTAGPLQKQITYRLSNTSKLALANVGRVIQSADAHIHKGIDTTQDPNNYPLSQVLKQLAQAYEHTCVQLSTVEELNNFNLHISVSELPPLGTVLPLLMQLPRAMPENLTPKAVKPKPADKAVASMLAGLELSWVPGINAAKHKVYFGTKIDELSLLSEVTSPRYTELPVLEGDSTYYWRVDEVQADGSVTAGDVWSFTTGKLIGWWKFDEGSGNTAADSSGNGNNGTIIGATWVDGKIGKALDFKGADYVIIPADVLSSLDKQITITLWQYGDPSIQPQNDYIFEACDARNFRVLCCHIPWGDSNVYWDAGGIPGRFDRIGKTADASQYKGRWNHWAFTKNADTGEMKIYLNGELWQTGSQKVRTLQTAATFKLGSSYIGTDNYDGLIDDFRIYNYVLSEAEIEMLCRVKAIKPQPADGTTTGPAENVELSWVPAIGTTTHKIYVGTEPSKLALLAEMTKPHYSKLPALQEGVTYYWRVDEVLANGTIAEGDLWSFSAGKLVGWWKFDEGSGSTATDSSGNGKNGTIIGATWVDGKVGKALRFKGADYVEIPPLNFYSNSMTITAWIKRAASHDDNAGIMFTCAHTVGGLYIMGDGDIGYAWFNEGPPLSYVVYDGDVEVDVPDETWTYVALVVEPTKATLYMCPEGSADINSVENVTAHEPQSWDAISRIGSASTQQILPPGRFFKGQIDDVRIYNYALGKADIMTLYKGTH